jgi:sensor histidine kinase YesM
VTKHEFIFSDKRFSRIARHVAFWFLWCLAFNLLFHFPIHVFKGWSFNGPRTKNLQELGPLLFFIKTFFVNSLFGVIVPQIAFTYALIYWLLPNYFYKQRPLFLVCFINVILLIAFFSLAILFKYSPVLYNSVTRTQPLDIPGIASMQRFVIIDQLTSLPIITGFALMIKLIKRWWLKLKETEQLAREKIKAELQLLKAQVHPHFLFNTLNNIYFFTMSGSPKAPEMIEKLSGLLHYILHECDQPLVPLEKEIKMIRDYMELEKVRYGEQMIMLVELPGDCKNKTIAPLLLIPFVENSFKHGASKVLTTPRVKLKIQVTNNTLHFFIENSKPSINETTLTKGSIGLKNVRKRLELLYPGDHQLRLVAASEVFTVDLKIQLQNVASVVEREEVISTSTYALA